MYEDKTLTCKECGKEFIFTAGEQEFYAEKGFENEPQRCKACRSARKAAGRTEYETFETTCSECGGVARVRVTLKNKPDILCSACFQKKKDAEAAAAAKSEAEAESEA